MLILSRTRGGCILGVYRMFWVFSMLRQEYRVPFCLVLVFWERVSNRRMNTPASLWAPGQPSNTKPEACQFSNVRGPACLFLRFRYLMYLLGHFNEAGYKHLNPSWKATEEQCDSGQVTGSVNTLHIFYGRCNICFQGAVKIQLDHTRSWQSQRFKTTAVFKGKKDSWTWTIAWWLRGEGSVRGLRGNEENIIKLLNKN